MKLSTISYNFTIKQVYVLHIDYVYYNIDIPYHEIHTKPSLSWPLDRIDQVSPVIDDIFEPGCDGEGVDIYILYTGKQKCFECAVLNLILYI